jgi:hypothetical protein
MLALPGDEGARKRRLIAAARERVPIEVACRVIGMDVPDMGELRSRKLYCPFGDTSHSDGGREPACRIFREPLPHLYCWACPGYFDPVRLLQTAWDLDAEAAALRLLGETGYRETSPDDVWNESGQPPEPDRDALAAALRTYCNRVIPAWSSRQYDPDAATMLAQCLGLLIYVRTEEDSRTWLSGTKVAMRRLAERG